MISAVEEKTVVEKGPGVEKNETDLVQEAVRVNEEMWQAKYVFDQIRRSKTIDTITHDDIRVRDEWRAKREELITLLRALPDDVSFDVDLAPPLKMVGMATELTTDRTVKGVDWAGETRIRPDDDRTGAVEVQTDAEPITDTKSEVDTHLKLGPMAGRDYTNMTMEEIDAMIFNAKATAKSRLGIADEGLSLWEEQKRLKQMAEDKIKERDQAETKVNESREKAEAETRAKEAKEREEAEAREKRVEEIKTALSKLYHEIWNRKQELEDVSINFKRAKDIARMIESAGLEVDATRLKGEIKDLEKEKKELESELAKLEKGVGKPFKDRFKEAYEKAKTVTFFGEEEPKVDSTGTLKPTETPKSAKTLKSAEISKEPEKTETQETSKNKFSLWKWTKERVKTFFKDGGLFGEFVQAETMRQGTGHAANSAEALSALVKTEWNVDSPDAVQDIVNEALKIEKKTGVKMDSQSIEQISGKRKEANDDEKNYIIKDAIDNLKLNLAKARGQATSESVLSPENLAQVEVEMRAELNKLSDAALVKDVKGFSKVMRDNLDKYWWLRYLYGGAEAALLVGGTVYMALPGPEQIAAAKVAGAAKGGAVATEGLRQSADLIINKSVWNTLQSLAEEKGVDLAQTASEMGFSSTDQLLQNWSQQVLDLNSAYEPAWTSNIVDGLSSSRTMPVGMMLKIPGVIMAILG